MSRRLLLVRHGESVDNVAGLYAGSRDSPLTNHGVLQAQRLADHLAARSPNLGRVTHIYASNLQRAVRTAQAIADAQSSVAGVEKKPEVVQVPELREKDFGSDEGKRFGTRGTEGTATSSAAGYVPSESRESMKTRTDRFIDIVLVPTLAQVTPPVEDGAIVIVAHGIILNVLLKCLLTRFGPDEVAKLAGPGDTPWRSEWLSHWSNTGYLEAVLQVEIPVAEPTPITLETSSIQSTPAEATVSQLADEQSPTADVVGQGDSPVDDEVVSGTSVEVPVLPSAPPHSMTPIIQISVKAVNYIEHLKGLKKTRGGIGSAASDSTQRTMDSFFSRPAKKPKTGREDS